MKKKKTIEFVLNEQTGFVNVLLASEGKLVLDYENIEVKAVRVIYPLPQKDKMLENAKFWIEKDKRFKDVAAWLDFYITAREKDIFEEIQKTRKSINKLCRINKCIQIAQEVKKGIK
jgi:hypothetical protein